MLLDLILQVLEKDWNQLSPEEIALIKDYIRYSAKFEKTITELERGLHSTDDPKRIAMQTMITACEFYDADWCGILLVDLDIGIWIPYWWYDVKEGEMADTLFYDFEVSEEYERWVTALKAGDPIIIDDVDGLKENYPAEYENYTRLEASSIIGVPFWKRPSGYIVVRNPKRNKLDSNMLRIMAYVAVSTVNESRMMENFHMTERSPEIQKENDLYINLFGRMEVHSAKFDIDETRVNSPMGWHILAYLLLHPTRNAGYGELAEKLWDEPPTQASANKVRGAIYRFRRNYESLTQDYITISEGSGYGLNQKYNITTDADLFEKYWLQSQDMTSKMDKIELLKKAFGLYRGRLCESCDGATWLLQEAYRYEAMYSNVVNALLSTLFEIRDYSCVRDYATKSFLIDPNNTYAHYWLVMALIKNRNKKLAREAVENAKGMLSEEDFADMITMLNKLEPGFIK
jgi:DNA-binding SARP family transcriptional activator